MRPATCGVTRSFIDLRIASGTCCSRSSNQTSCVPAGGIFFANHWTRARAKRTERSARSGVLMLWIRMCVAAFFSSLANSAVAAPQSSDSGSIIPSENGEFIIARYSRVDMDLRARVAGTLLGTALGDALGLPCEGMSAKRIARRFGKLDRYRLLGRTGYVSDDTEQSALVAQSLAGFPAAPDRCARAFRRSLVGWFWRLPWGIGMATIRSCFRTMLGFSRTGVRSAGNGSAMRAAVIGAYFHDRPDQRRAFGTAIATSTHTDDRAVQGALFVAELAAV